MLKKYLSIVIIILTCLAVTGCNSKKEDSSTGTIRDPDWVAKNLPNNQSADGKTALQRHHERQAKYEAEKKAKKDAEDKKLRQKTRPRRVRAAATLLEKMSIIYEERPKRQTKPVAHSTDFSQSKPFENIYAVNESRRQFYDLGIEHLKTIETLDANVRERAVKYCQQVLENQFPSSTRIPHSWSELYETAQEIIAAECDDPMFQFACSMNATALGKHKNSLGHIDESMKNFFQSDYPNRILALAAQHDLEIETNYDVTRFTVNKVLDSQAIIYHWLKEDFQAKSDEYVFVYETIDYILNYARYVSQRGALEFIRMLVDQKLTPPWVSEMLDARYWDELAWAARGSGYAHTVSKGGWQRFEDHNKRSAEFARQAYQLNPSWPHAATEMLGKAYLGVDDKGTDYWLKKAQLAQFDFPRIYSVILNFSQPKWGGNPEDLLEFGMKCYRTGRYDTDVPFVLCRIIGTIRIDYENDEESLRLLSKSDVYQAMRDCLEKYMKFRPEKKNYYLSVRAVLTRSTTRHLDKAIEDLIELDEVVDVRALNMIESLSSAGEWTATALAREAEHYEPAVQVVQLLRERQFDPVAIRKAAEAGLVDNIDPIEREYFETIIGMADAKEAFARGEWVDYEFGPNLMGWAGYGFECITVEDDSTILMDSNFASERQAVSIEPRIEFDGPKTMEVEIEVMDMGELFSNFSVGFHFVLPNNQSHLVELMRQSNWIRTYIADGVSVPTQIRNRPFGKRKLRINITEGYIECFIDDQFVYALNSDKVVPAGRFFLGPSFRRNFRGSARFSNFRVRKWDLPKCPLGNDIQRRSSESDVIDWFEQASKLDPQLPYYVYRLALAHYNDGQFEKAAEIAAKARELGHPKSETALIEGHAFELAGDFQKAMECYRWSDDTENKFELRFVEDDKVINYVGSAEFQAKLRSHWLASTIETDGEEIPELGRFPYQSGKKIWFVEYMRAASNARTSFTAPISTLKKLLKEKEEYNLPPEMVPVVREQLAAYEDGRRWFRDSSKLPFYHGLKIQINRGHPDKPGRHFRL